MSSIRVFSTQPAAVLRFSGEDHLEFLQSQGTADLRGPSGTCRYCLWLDHKGLIHADAFVLKISEEEVLLVSYESAAADLIGKFQRHIIADDVAIADETAAWKLLSIAPDSVTDFYKDRSIDETVDTFQIEADGYCFRGRRLGGNSVDYLVPALTDCPFLVAPIAPADAEAMRIQAGVPSIPRDIPPGTFNPVEANILSAIAFNKGCYLGQEVVARVHRLGRLSTRMITATALEGGPLHAGALTADGRTIGAITSVAKLVDTTVGIGWLKSKTVDGAHHFGDLLLEIATLPPS